MTAYAWVSVIAMVAWLVLAAGSYRAYRLGARKTLLMATAWLGLFLLVTGIFVVVGT